jgi:hypothetical protein
MDEQQHRHQLNDIVSVASDNPTRARVNGRIGFIDAVRRGRDDHWQYAVQICPEGLGWSCPGRRPWIMDQSELVPTGQRYRECTYASSQWPPKTFPRFQKYEKVIVGRPSGSDHAVTIGVVADMPECDAAGRWWYQIRCEADNGLTLGEDVGDVPEEDLTPTGEISQIRDFELEHPPPYAGDEQVLIATHDERKAFLNGRLGFIVGRGAHPNPVGEWSYTVSVYGERELWWFSSRELEATGGVELQPENPDGSTAFHPPRHPGRA